MMYHLIVLLQIDPGGYRGFGKEELKKNLITVFTLSKREWHVKYKD